MDRIDALLAAAKLGPFADDLRRLIRPAIGLATRAATDGDLAVGATRFGGVPDLPADFAWPATGDEPIAFVAQIRLDEIGSALRIDI